MLNRPRASRPARFIGQLLEGAARPVGGSAEATLQLVGSEAEKPEARHPSILEEARQFVRQRKERQVNQAAASAS